ncbi:MAG: nuclear transport factor 2 family protein [Acidimicrobiales bacterium]|jgi:hypothetical protein
MKEALEPLEELARKVKLALQAADLSLFAEFLDPHVHWGPPGDPSPPCQNRDQVIAWYERAKSSGMNAQVGAVTVVADRVLVELVVSGTDKARRRTGQARWQVLAVRDGRVVDIVGFDQKDEAVAWANRSEI